MTAPRSNGPSFLAVVYSLAARAYPVFAHIYGDNNRPK